MENEWTKKIEELETRVKELERDKEGLQILCDKAAKILVKIRTERDSYKQWIDAIGGRG